MVIDFLKLQIDYRFIYKKKALPTAQMRVIFIWEKVF